MPRFLRPTEFVARLIAAALFIVLSFGGAVQAGSVPIPDGTQLIILRHADRVGEDLTPKGIARAEALPVALKGVEIDAVYSPGIKRNLDTAAPLLKATGLSVKRIPTKGAAARMMSEGAGKTVVWIGNKGNLAQIWEDLGAPGAAPLEYGDLFFVTRGADGAPKVRREHLAPLK